MATTRTFATPETRHLHIENFLQRFNVVLNKLGRASAVRATKWIAIWGPTGRYEEMREAVVALFQDLPPIAQEPTPGDNARRVRELLAPYKEGSAPDPDP